MGLKRNLIWTALAMVLALYLSGCSENSPGTTGEPGTEPGKEPGKSVMNLNGVEFGVVGQSNIQSDGSSISGSGTVVFRDALTDEDNNYAVKVSLKPGGSLEVQANAGPGLSKGAGFKFTRDANDELKIEVNTSDKYIDVTEDYKDMYGAVDASEELLLEIDVHGHGHVVLWVNNGEEYEEATRRVNGTVWGLVLDNATVTQAKRSEPKDKH